MRLDDLPWRQVTTNRFDAELPGFIVHRIRGTLYTIEQVAAPWGRWYDLDAVTAQAVLYELLREDDDAAG